jgi:hypothetical protein
VADIYLGFNIWDIARGDYSIQSFIVEDGFFNIIVHTDGTLNIQNALESHEKRSTEAQPMDFYLESIKLRNLDIHKMDEKAQTDLETFIYDGAGSFTREKDKISAHIDTEFKMNLIDHGDILRYIRMLI